MSGPLATLAERSWLTATDDAAEQRIAETTPEELYKLGFLNGIQACVIGATDESHRELTSDAIAEAVELMEGGS